jgi:hypothetical protein
MKKLALAAVLALSLPLALASTAAAAPETSGSILDKSKCQKARDRRQACEMIFDKGDTLEGGVPGSDGDQVHVRKDSFFGTLIRLRWDFHAEILASADEL